MKKIIVLFVFCFTFFNLFSQSKRLFDFDYSQSGYDSLSNSLEVYYSFNQDRLSKVNNSLEGILKISISDSATGKQIIDKNWKISHQVIDSAEKERNLVGVLRFKLEKGKYKLVVSGGNNNKETMENIVEYISVNPFYDGKISMSDIQLASNIIQESQNKNSLFYKNSLEVIPNPTGVFGVNLPVVFFYTEIYNLENVHSDHTLKLYQLIYNSSKQLVGKKIKEISPNTSTRVEVGFQPINKFPADTYTLILSLIDSAGNFGITSTKKFYVFNPNISKDSTAGSSSLSLSTEFGAMSDEELDDLYAKSKYIATPSEASRFGKLKGTEAKRDFLFQFWQSRDEDPSTPQNESFHKYLGRLQGANDRFGTPTKIGWKTDRGRTFMIYGEPDEIEKFPNQMDTKPYEIWHYNEIEGGVYFVFADLTGFSDYMLIHSTKRGEIRDDNWQRRISN